VISTQSTTPHALLDGILFAFYLFIPLFTFWLVTKKQYLIWGIGIALPMLIAFTAGAKGFFTLSFSPSSAGF